MTVLAKRHLDGFLSALASAGLPIVVERRIDFFRALTKVPIFSIDDLYWVARASLVSGFDQIGIFDIEFDAWFRGTAVTDKKKMPAPEESQSNPLQPGMAVTLPPVTSGEGTGRAASFDEFLLRRTLPHTDAEKRDICLRIGATASENLPRKRVRRSVRSNRSGRLDMRRILGQMRRSGGEIVELYYRRQPWRMRRVVMLIDISGSLKATSPDALRAAHALMQVAPHMEVFTFGTRLTRVTSALCRADVDDSLTQLSDLIFDFNGGTRIGLSFNALLEDRYFRTFCRGALVIVVSDGLERGEVDTMREATERLSLLAHRLVWLTPLMSDPTYEPATRGMQAILSSIDHLGNATSLTAFCDEIGTLQAIIERGQRRRVAAALPSAHSSFSERNRENRNRKDGQ